VNEERSSVPALVTVIVPVFNAASTLPEQLAALGRQTYPGRWEVVIADNGSTDGSTHVASEWARRLPDLRIVDCSDRRGPSHARNEGVRAARGDFIVACDADDVVSERWLEAMTRAAATCDVVAGRTEVSVLNPSPVSARTPSQGDHPAFGVMPYAATSNFGAWRRVFEAIGGWNESYAAKEDVEFSWKAQLAGYRLGYAEDAVVHYRFRETLREHTRRRYQYARAGPQLYRDFRNAGMRRAPYPTVLKQWAWSVVHLPDAFSRGRRARWMEVMATQVGRIRGSLQYRVVYL